VIRNRPHPALMVNDEVERPYRTALAAVDLSEPSANVVKTSMTLGLLGTLRLGWSMRSSRWRRESCPMPGSARTTLMNTLRVSASG